MPATVTLNSTTLSEAIGAADGSVKLASVSDVFPGYFLYVDGELMRVISVGIGTNVNVTRGVGGTGGVPHVSGLTVYIGQGHQFYHRDPVGRPNLAIPVSPYINLANGSVWFARGDATDSGNRWWQEQTVTREVGALGVVTTSLDPTSST